MEFDYLKDIIEKAVLVNFTDEDWYVGVLKENILKYAYCGKYSEWIKKINTDETETITLSKQQSYSVKQIPRKDRNCIDRCITLMNHIKKYRDEYIENELFDKFY